MSNGGVNSVNSGNAVQTGLGALATKFTRRWGLWLPIATIGLGLTYVAASGGHIALIVAATGWSIDLTIAMLASTKLAIAAVLAVHNHDIVAPC